MGGTTASPWLLPYPTGTDKVADGDNAIQALADRTHANFASESARLNAVDLEPPWSVMPTQLGGLNTGWTGSIVYSRRGGWVHVWISVLKPFWAAGDYLSVNLLPVGCRPYSLEYGMVMESNEGRYHPLQIATNGAIVTVVTSTQAGAGAGGGIAGSMSFPGT